MDFTLDAEQQLLRDSVRAFLRDEYGFDQRLAAIRSDAGWQPGIWSKLARYLGLLGIGTPERLGGTGGGAAENMIVMQVFSRAVVVEHYVETVVIGAAALGACPGCRGNFSARLLLETPPWHLLGWNRQCASILQ